MNTRGLISYLWRPLICLRKKLVHLPLSGSYNRLLKISFSIGFRNMKSTHVYSFGHDLINIEIKMLKKVPNTRDKRGKTKKSRENKRKSKPAGEGDVDE